MKKSIFRVLTLSLVVGGVGLISSCKDYDEDLRAELNSEIANLNVTLNQKIDQQIAGLQGQLTTLQTQLALINSCDCGVNKPWASDISSALAAKPWTSDLSAAIASAIAGVNSQLNGLAGQIPTDAEISAIATQVITSAMNQQLGGYYTKDQVDQAIANAIAAIQTCGCDLEALKTELSSSLSSSITTIVTQNIINQVSADAPGNIKDALEGNFATKDELQALQDKVNQITSTACACENLTVAIQTINNKLADVDAHLQQHCDSIAQLYVDYKELNQTLTEVKNTADQAYNLAKDVPELKDAIEALQNKDTELAGLISEAQTKAEEAYTKADDAATKAADALLKYEAQKVFIQNLRDSLKNTMSQVDTNKGDIANLQSEVEKINNQITINRDSIAILKQLCDDNLVIAKIYAKQQIKIAQIALEQKINNRIDSLDVLVKAADAATNARIDSLNTKLVEQFGDIADQFETVTTDIESLTQTISDNYDDLNGRVSNIEQWLVSDFVDFQDQVNDDIQGLQDAVADLTDRVDAAESAISGLESRVANIETTLKKMVTGVNVNAIYNPVFGSMNWPTNTKTNVLVAFYGQNDGADVVFPDVDPLNYVRSSEAFTAKEWEMIEGSVQTVNIKAGKKLIADDEANAGTVYLTINPNTTDFTGANLELVNSQGKSAGMILSPLAKSDKVLKLGYSRAADNGFYEMNAKIEDDADVQKINFEAGRFKDVLSDAKNYKDGFDLANAVKTVYDLFNDMLDANAVKATWEDGEGVQHSVYSDYNIAATAVHPLSYNFLADKHFTSVPGFDRINSFIDRGANRVVNQLKKALDKAFNKVVDGFPEAPEMKEFNLDPSSVDYQKMVACFDVKTNATIKYHDLTYTIGNDLYLYKMNADGTRGEKLVVDGKEIALPKNSEITVKDGEMQIHIEMDLRDLFGEFYENVAGNVNDLIESLHKFAEDATNALKSMNDISASVSDISNDLVGSLHNLLNKIEKKLVSFMNTAVSYLQPVMMYTAGNGMHIMSGAVNYPNKVSATSITLHPYSYTAETINPAYKKHVAVVNVIKNDKSASAQDGDATCKALLDAVNSQANMNKAINGKIHDIAISGLKSGYTYQFAYTAMDYSGYIVTKRSAISVK